MDKPRISYTPHPDATPKTEVSVLADVYRIALQKYRDKHEATHPGSPDDAMKGSNDDRARTIIPRG
jgi:hypothetical protein